jgi:hypothetical protein
MDEALREARRVLALVKENPKLLQVLVEVLTRLGPDALDEISYSDLAHLVNCKRTYSNCRVPICRKLRLWYYDSLQEIERERRYWKKKGIEFPEREQV